MATALEKNAITAGQRRSQQRPERPRPERGPANPQGPRTLERDEIDHEAVAAEEAKIAETNRSKSGERSQQRKPGVHPGPGGTKEGETAVSAFFKGAGGGFVHAKREGRQSATALAGTTPLDSIHQREAAGRTRDTVAVSFGFERDKDNWDKAGKADRSARKGAASGVKSFAAEANYRREQVREQEAYEPTFAKDSAEHGEQEMGG